VVPAETPVITLVVELIVATDVFELVQPEVQLEVLETEAVEVPPTWMVLLVSDTVQLHVGVLGQSAGLQTWLPSQHVV